MYILSFDQKYLYLYSTSLQNTEQLDHVELDWHRVFIL